MSDYLGMSIRELQAECKRRGLPTGRTKDELLVRLVEADALDQADKLKGWQPTPTTFRVEFPHRGELDDAAHRMFRTRAYDQAKIQKLTPRGGPLDPGLVEVRKDGTVYTYEVLIK